MEVSGSTELALALEEGGEVITLEVVPMAAPLGPAATAANAITGIVVGGGILVLGPLQ